MRPFQVTTNAAVKPAGIEGEVRRLLQLRLVELRRQRRVGQPIAHRPVLRRRIRQRALHRDRREEHVLLADRQRHAALAAEVLRRAGDAVGHRDVHGLAGAIDDGLADLRARLVGAGEVADVLLGEVGIEAGDEDGRAHHLGVAGGVVLERIARRRDVGGVQLERLRPVEHELPRGVLLGLCAVSTTAATATIPHVNHVLMRRRSSTGGFYMHEHLGGGSSSGWRVLRSRPVHSRPGPRSSLARGSWSRRGGGT